MLQATLPTEAPQGASRRHSRPEVQTSISRHPSQFPRGRDSLGLGLLCDIADGGALLANDGAHVLGGHQKPQRDVHLLLLGRGSGSHRRALSGLTPRAKASAAPVLRTLCNLLIRDIGHLQGMVLQLVAIQLHDGSVDRERAHWSLRPMPLTPNALCASRILLGDSTEHAPERDLPTCLPHPPPSQSTSQSKWRKISKGNVN